MVISGRRTHVNHDVHEGCCLGDLPVQTSRGCGRGHLREIDDYIAHGSEEVVLVDFDESRLESAFIL